MAMAITAKPQPVIDRQTLMVAARAFTYFLRFLIAEIPLSFMILKVIDTAPWFAWTASLGLNKMCCVN